MKQTKPKGIDNDIFISSSKYINGILHSKYQAWTSNIEDQLEDLKRIGEKLR